MRRRLLLAAVLAALAPLPAPASPTPEPDQAAYTRAIRDAQSLLQRGQFEEALGRLEPFRGTKVADRAFVSILGTCLRKLGRFEEACSLYREGAEAFEREGKSPAPMLIELERALREKRQPDRAFEVCLEIHRLGGDLGSWIRDEMESLILADDLGERALPLLEKEIASRPEANDLKSLRVSALFFLGRYEESLSAAVGLDAALQAGGRTILEHLRLLDKKGVGEPALAAVQAAASAGLKGAEMQEALMLKAAALRRLRRPAEAAAAFEEAAAVDGPLALAARRDRATLLVEDLGRLEEGARAYEDLLAHLETLPPAGTGRLEEQTLVALADCRLRLGRYEEAGEILKRVEALDRDPAAKEEAVFQQAEIRLYSGEIDAAREGYDRVVKEFAGGALVNDALDRLLLLTRAGEAGAIPLAALGQVAYQRRIGAPERALEIAREAGALCGDCPAAEDLLREEAGAMLEMGDLAAAAEAADSLAARFPDAGSAPSLLREVADRMRLEAGATEAVLRRYEDLVVRFPRSHVALEVRALIEEIRSGGDAGSAPSRRSG